MTGKISTFGGQNDSGMTHSEGLAVFEHGEASMRPDLFTPRATDLTEGASKRLRHDALYFAMRFEKNVPRGTLQQTVWKFTNPKNGLQVLMSLVDWGPHERTGRVFDISPRAAELLRVKTDDELIGEMITGQPPIEM